METELTVKYKRSPSLLKSYMRILLKGRGEYHGESPWARPLSCSTPPQEIRPEHRARFITLTRSTTSSGTLPLLYPSVLATPLRLALLAHKAFRLNPMGLLHTGSEITLYEPLRGTAQFSFRCATTAAQETPRGLTLILTTTAFCGETLVWEERAHFLSRGTAQKEGSASRHPRRECEPDFAPQKHTSFLASSEIGRLFASFTGDLNPIHLVAPAAKFFGFRAPIAHGLWSLSRSLAALGEDRPSSPCTLSAHFLRPLFLPSQLDLRSRKGEDGEVTFALFAPFTAGPLLCATLAPL